MSSDLQDSRRTLTGGLLLVDHVASTGSVVLAIQRLFEMLTIRWLGDHQTRRPLPLVAEAGLVIEKQERYKRGVVERLAARKPASPHGAG